MAKNISDADRARARRMTTNESGRTISDADRRARTIANKKLKEMMGEGSKNVDAMDKARVEEITEQYEKYLRRNDGGIARKTKVF